MAQRSTTSIGKSPLHCLLVDWGGNLTNAPTVQPLQELLAVAHGVERTPPLLPPSVYNASRRFYRHMRHAGRAGTPVRREGRKGCIPRRRTSGRSGVADSIRIAVVGSILRTTVGVASPCPRRPTLQRRGTGARNPLSGTDLCFYNRLKRWSPHKRRLAANDSCGGKLQEALAKFPPVVPQTSSAADWCSLGRGISVVGT